MNIHIQLLTSSLRNDIEAHPGHEEENYAQHAHAAFELIREAGYHKEACDCMIGPEGGCSKHYVQVWSNGFSFVVTWDGMFHVTQVGKVLGWMTKEEFMKYCRLS